MGKVLGLHTLSGAPKAGANQDARVDELLELIEWENEIAKPKLKRLKLLKDTLVSEINKQKDADIDQSYTRSGADGVATISAAVKERKIKDLRMVHMMLGDDVFYEAASVPLKVIDDYLAPHQRDEVLDKDGRGSRRVTVTRHGAAD
jgi:hypothetical protein